MANTGIWMVAFFQVDLPLPAGKMAVRASYVFLAARPAVARTSSTVVAHAEAGRAKVVLRAVDLTALERVAARASSRRVPHAVIVNAARAVLVEPTTIALSIGPISKTKCCALTRCLQLLCGVGAGARVVRGRAVANSARAARVAVGRTPRRPTRTDCCERYSAGSRDGGARSRIPGCLDRLLMTSRPSSSFQPQCNPSRDGLGPCFLTLDPAPTGLSATALIGTSERASAMTRDGLAAANGLRNQGAFGCDNSRRFGSIPG